MIRSGNEPTPQDPHSPPHRWHLVGPPKPVAAVTAAAAAAAVTAAFLSFFPLCYQPRLSRAKGIPDDVDAEDDKCSCQRQPA